MVLSRAAANFRYAAGLRRFLRTPVTPDEGRRLIRERLAGRDQAFLRLLERSVYANPKSPYSPLLRSAGVELEDARRMVEQAGLKGALERLYDAGVFVALDEFKGRKPIRRGGLEIDVRQSDFDNPVITASYEGTTSGSRGVGSRLLLDFDFLNYESAHYGVFLDVWGLMGRPTAVWRAGPPATDGLRAVFRFAKVGSMPARWFSPAFRRPSAEALRASLFTYYTLAASRVIGRPIPKPRFVPRDRAVEVARWLAAMKARGTPVVVNANASASLRACIAARDAGLDIAGTAFIQGGEPFTAGKAAIMAEAGARPIVAYAMQELGTISFGCPNPVELDDQHVLSDKLEVIQRPKQVMGDGPTVDALIYTGLFDSGPKVMINVESGDYATLRERDCGCEYVSLGLGTLLSGIRSYEKLTSEGVTFIGSDLYDLLERTLPSRFGGEPSDYQLVEEEQDGLPKVSIVVAPRVGPVDDADVVGTVLRAFGAYRGGALMSEELRQGNTLRVVRREPYQHGSKIMPLHVVRPR